MNLLSKIQAFNNQIKDTVDGLLSDPPPHHPHLQSTPDDKVATLAFIIIDRSVSMNTKDYLPSRLQAAKEAAIAFIMAWVAKGTHANICVIAFDNKATLVTRPTSIVNYKQIVKKIESIAIRGGTDIAIGLKEADRIAADIDTDSVQGQIILLTDGCGGHPIPIAEKLKCQFQMVIDVVGIGGSRSQVNEALLKTVATTEPDGTSHYRFIKDAATLKQHYRKLATGILWEGKNQ